MPYERLVLIGLAILRALVVGSAALTGWTLAARGTIFPPSTALKIIFAATFAIMAAWTCADVFEHVLKGWLLGYDFNPFVMSIGEWEGWMGPTTSSSPQDMATWNLMKCGPPPGGNVHPLLSWWGNPGSGSFCK